MKKFKIFTNVIGCLFSILFLSGCFMFVTSAEDKYWSDQFSFKVRAQTFLSDLPEGDTRKHFYIHGGAGAHYASGCYVVLWDNPDSRKKSQNVYSPEEIKTLLLGMQRISKEIDFPRAVNVRDAWSGKKRFIVGPRGKYIKGLEKLDEIIKNQSDQISGS